MEYTDYDELPEVERKYKDTVFRMLFRKKAELLSLYNAVNKTNFTNVDDLEITTLENAVYMGMKNDVSCMFAFELSLYEHQSTVNPNMPLRDLFYVTQQLQKLVLEKDLYSSWFIFRHPDLWFFTMVVLKCRSEWNIDCLSFLKNKWKIRNWN